MQHSPSWESNRFTRRQEIPCILWNPNVHYGVYKCPPPVPVLSQISLFHVPLSTFLRSILVLFSNLCLDPPSGLFPSGFPTNTLYTPLLSPIRAACLAQSHYSRFYNPNNKGWRVQIIKLLIMQFSPLPYYLVRLRPDILLSTLFSKTLSLLSSWMWETMFHTPKNNWQNSPL